MPTESKHNRVRAQKLIRVAQLFDPRGVMLEQIQPLLQGAGTSLAANAVIALIVAASMSGGPSAAVALSWTASCLIIVLCSAVVMRVVNRNFYQQSQLSTASWVLTVASAMRGMVWGLGFIVLMPNANGFEQVMLGWMLAGLMCGGAFSSWSHPAASMAFAGLAGVGGFIGMTQVPGIGTTWTPYAVPVLFVFLMRAVVVSVQVLRKSVLAEQEIKAKSEVIGLLLKDFEEQASDWLWETDARGYLTRGVERFARLLEIGADKFESRSLPMICEVHGLADASEGIFRSKFLSGESFRDLVVGLKAGGMQRFVKFSAKPVMGERGTVVGWHGVASDVTDERLADMKVRKLALFDSLTELPNRGFFNDRLSSTLENKGDLAHWVMYLDLDGFKGVNDTLGHAVGDQLLRSVAVRLQSCLPAKGMLARLGGDEFAVLAHCDESKIVGYASHMTNALELPFSVSNHDIMIGVSIGIAAITPEISDLDELMRRADVALYATKQNNKGGWRIYDEVLDRAQVRRMDVEKALRTALQQKQFVLHYQPIVDIKSGAVHSYEALLRLETEKLGTISPAEFIPVAEETGLINEIGEWVIRRACEDAVRWPNSLCVAVNVSPLQLKSHRIIATVTRALFDTGLLPHRLELELTESALVENIEQTGRILGDLKALGVRLALDDFGTGYSSLAHLHQFNFDKIKIDRSFVQSFAERRESAAVVNAVAHLARDLGITMTAEGVETKAHLDAMRDAGCDHVQGYLLGRPQAQPNDHKAIARQF